MTSRWSLKGCNRDLSKFLHHSIMHIKTWVSWWGGELKNNIWFQTNFKRSKWKTDARFELPTLKNLYFDIHQAKKYFLSLDLWGEVRGHFRWPTRGQNEKPMPDLNSRPQKTYILICMKQKNIFWVLTSGEWPEVILDDLQEVEMKNWCQIWTPHPKKPIFWYA